MMESKRKAALQQKRERTVGPDESRQIATFCFYNYQLEMTITVSLPLFEHKYRHFDNPCIEMACISRCCKHAIEIYDCR